MGVNLSGTWHANLANSHFVTAAPRALTVTIQHADPRLEQTITVTRADGSQEQGFFECWTDGRQDQNRLNGNLLRGSARWAGEELVIESRVGQGARELYFMDCWSLSPNGDTLTMEHRADALTGQRVVLDRARQGEE